MISLGVLSLILLAWIIQLDRKVSRLEQQSRFER